MRDTLSSGTAVEIARPEGTASRGLVIAPDIMGLRPLFDAMAERLAAEHGWAVAAVEPFPGQESLPLDQRMTAVKDLDEARSMNDLVAAAELLGRDPVGVIGFCMGGMNAMKAAATGRFDRAVGFYGMIRVPEAWAGGSQRDTLDVLAAAPGSAERVLAIVGTADPYTPANDIDDLEAMGAAVVRYEGAEHGFVHDPERPAHRPGDAADAWRRAAEWLTGLSGP